MLDQHKTHITGELMKKAWAKQLFVTTYKAASEKAFSQENVRQGFRVTGIYPVDASKGLSALKPKERRWRTKPAPTTPEKAPEVVDTLWSTPHCSQDTTKQLEHVNPDENHIGRDLQDILRKIEKAVDESNCRIIHLEEEMALLKASQAEK